MSKRNHFRRWQRAKDELRGAEKSASEGPEQAVADALEDELSGAENTQEVREMVEAQIGDELGIEYEEC